MKKFHVQNQQSLKYHNCRLVLDIIRDSHSEPISRADISKNTKMSPTSITRITSTLIKMKIVETAETFSTGVGRNGTRLRITNDSIYSLGIGIYSNIVRACIMSVNGSIVAEKHLDLDRKSYSPEEIIDISKMLYDEMIKHNTSISNKLRAVGIACVGNVNHLTGEVYFAPQMGWKNFNIKQIAQKSFSLPIFVDNDTKMSLIGSTFQSESMRQSDVLYIVVGEGVGASVMYNGNIVRGVNNAAGEIGHTIIDPNGRVCVCGRRGCLATCLTERGIVEQSNLINNNVESFDEIFKAFKQNNEWAIQVINDFVLNLSNLVSNMIYTYNTKYILIGGFIVARYPEVYEMVYEKLKNLMHDNLYSAVVIKPRIQENNAILGAAYVAINNYIDMMIQQFDDE